MEHARGGAAQAILASSGCANVCTGEHGLRDAREMTRTVGRPAADPAQPRPHRGHRGHRRAAAHGPDPGRAAQGSSRRSRRRAAAAAAEAIMTTDTRPKEAALRVEVNGRSVTMGGIAKGVGMIEPHLATMFCFIATDAAVARGALAGVVRRSVDRSFNRATVDCDTVDQRHGGRAGQRAGREPRRSRSAGGGCGSSRAGARGPHDPPGPDAGGRRRGGDQAGDGHRPGRGQPARRAGGGAQRGQLPAGEDGHQRGRPQLGPDHDGPGQVGGPDRPGQGRHRLRRGGPRRARRAQRRRAPGAHPRDHGRPGVRDHHRPRAGPGRGPRVDVRPQRGVRPDQRASTRRSFTITHAALPRCGADKGRGRRAAEDEPKEDRWQH